MNTSVVCNTYVYNTYILIYTNICTNISILVYMNTSVFVNFVFSIFCYLCLLCNRCSFIFVIVICNVQQHISWNLCVDDLLLQTYCW